MENLFVFNHFELYLIGITTLLCCIQLLYLSVTYARPLRFKRKKKNKPVDEVAFPPVSVIVYAKNESENLRKHLPVLLTQEYPEYEIIVVNDGSTDESDDILKMLEQEHKNLYHTFTPENVKYLSRKKLALTLGIKAAKHDILLFTEADCLPLSPNWIASMATNYTTETSIMLGFCAYGKYKGFLHKLIAYDNLVNGLQAISAALSGTPYTGDGRNLSYKKELFFANNGYQKSLNLHAGDDDLFVNQVATKRNTRITYNPESIMQMSKIERFNRWKEMKVSRAATQHHYKGGMLFFYRLNDLFFLLFALAVFFSIYVGVTGNWLIAVFAALLYLLRGVVKSTIFHKSAKILQQKTVTKWLFFLDYALPAFNLYVYIYRMFRGKNDYTFRLLEGK
ncbi:glycosyltransferase [Parabacteroides sp. PF5-9]|uniref:glycosyltransferase n=1 Tax=Parabacteroides sp. PF5-9 TaxID=1742404 RepID=UPI002476FF47|nr:glycosyltransferase [Parabacteroides sp. PF5-9]MDH6357665.1 glycosyltransferase involved in cell wall biosynthesis [Parabacteroides sp. PF5-9]